MNGMRSFGTFGLLTACIAAPAASLAAECSGTSINTTHVWEASEIADGASLNTWKARSVVVSDDTTSARHLLAGECIGSLRIWPNAAMQGSGQCARKDKDGDVLIEEWTMPAEAGGKGQWKNVGGTGKFADNNATGTWQRVMAEGVSAAIRWEGGC